MRFPALILAGLLLVALALIPTNLDAAQPTASTLLPITQTWRYNQTNISGGGNFQDIGYDDTGSDWASGSGLFAVEIAGVYPYPTLTPLALGRTTYYFRTHFNFTNAAAGLFLVFSNYIDDGAVIYLNGVELFRSRMPAGPITASTLANVQVPSSVSTSLGILTLPEGQALVLSFPASILQPGDNVLAAEVHQVGSESSDIVFGLSMTVTTGAPDLVIADQVNPRFEMHTYGPTDCEVLEGCAIAGTRRLLRFDTITRNIGTADLYLGNPVGNPRFYFHTCHNHYHFQRFADYRLVNNLGAVVATGNKVGFCLEDLQRFDPTAAASPYYNCTNQGIQRGWGDIYNSALPCQAVDITSTPPGFYWLELEIDPDHQLTELNETNNITRVPIEIAAPCTGPPPNDNFASARVLSNSIETVFGNNDCATSQPSEPRHVGIAGDRSIWFRWTAPAAGLVTLSTEGTSFDTLLAVYTGGSVNALTAVAANDDSSPGIVWSRVAFSAVAGTVYQIAVDGFGGAVGPVVLNLNPGGNDAFATCAPLVGSSGTIAGITTAATKEVNEPNHAGNVGGHSIWYCWTAPTTAAVTFDTAGSRFDTLLAVYTGSPLTSVALAGSNDNIDGFLTSRVSFNAFAGMTFRIAIDGNEGASGIAMLNWQPFRQLTSVQRSGSLFKFLIVGVPGDRYLIETSSNLTSWQPWTHVTNSGGFISVTDPLSATGARFYRFHTE